MSEPEHTGFDDVPGFPSWLTWKSADGCEVTYGDDGCGIISRFSGEKVITVSGSAHGSRWFETTDPRGLAAALIAAADHADAQAEPPTPGDA